MVLFQDVNYNKSFSQLAKESNFSFNLYRGRVDWRKIDSVDVDRLVRDQDVELLHINISNISNCNLESEYDVKILDPNFIKLFRLAQLLIDFLLHCKRYLEHCIKIAHENLQVTNKEVDVLRKQLNSRKLEVKQLKKKIKEVRQQLLYSPRYPNPNYECSLCGKVFLNEKYLDSHNSRRHVTAAFAPPLPLRPVNSPSPPPNKISVLQKNDQIKHSEDILSVKKKYQDEIEDLKSLFFAEIEKLKQSEAVKSQDGKNSLQTTNAEKESSVSGFDNTTDTTIQKKVAKEGSNDDRGSDEDGEKAWLQRLEEREGVWRARLASLDEQHNKQVSQLQDKLTSTQQQSQEMKKDLEHRLEEVLLKFEQSQAILESKQKESEKDSLLKLPKDNILITPPVKPREEKKEKQPLPHEEKREKHTQPHEEKREKLPQPYEEKREKQPQPHEGKREKQPQPPPFQKRKAFVAHKTRTIQDQELLESTQRKEQSSNLVKILQSDDESDFENTSVQVENKIKSSKDSKDLDEIKLPSFLQVNEKNMDVSIRSKNNTNLISKIIEDERLNMRNSGRKEPILEENESSITETATETESESASVEEEETHNQHLDKIKEPADKKVLTYDDNLLHTETELAQQSLQSMEALLAANPNILEQLRGDLNQLLERRLQGLGVDPAWGSLPPASFRSKMSTLQHQRQITAKSHPVYFTLRSKLNTDADAAVHSRPGKQSAADSLLARLRRKAAVIISAAKFTRSIGATRKQSNEAKLESMEIEKPQPLASSSPHPSPQPSVMTTPKQEANTTFTIPKIRSSASVDSLSLSSSTTGDESEREDKPPALNTTYTKTGEAGGRLYKSALRNAVSTGNLAKKKVLFVDEAIIGEKRSLSENLISPPNDVSISSLVQEIQQQLSQRSGKPANSIDLMQPSKLELPLSQLLPLSKSGRELLESEGTLASSLSKNSYSAEKSSPQTLHPLSQILQKVPVTKPSTLSPLGKQYLSKSSADLKITSKNLLQPPKLSPTLSITSFGSSLDVSLSPRDTKNSLELDLQDLEDNLRD